MIYCEAALITILVVVFAHASYTDIRTGVIKNRTLLYFAIPLLLIDVTYYVLYARDFALPFLMNLAVMSAISVLLYAYNVWAAGDSKLLILSVFALPARIFYLEDQSLAPTLYIFVITFSIAYAYLVVESAVIGIKEKNLFHFEGVRINALQFLKQYALCALYVTLANELWSLPMFGSFWRSNSIFVMTANLFLVLTVVSVRAFGKRAVILCSFIAAVLLGILTRFEYIGSFRIDTYMATIVIILLRMIAEKYNYQTIPTENVKLGMVLSWATVAAFQPSRGRGLPSVTTEDMRSRITAEEADSIVRWKDSKNGSETITIVRKLPFAIFIAVGTMAFMAMRVFIHGH